MGRPSPRWQTRALAVDGWAWRHWRKGVPHSRDPSLGGWGCVLSPVTALSHPAKRCGEPPDGGGGTDEFLACGIVSFSTATRGQ